MKSSEEIMEILEAFDLTGGFRAAAKLAGCDHKTVARYVALRDAGKSPDERPRRATAIDQEGLAGRPSAGVASLDPGAGLWTEFDWGHGPRIDGRSTLLFCAWLSWSRFQVVLPVWDRTLPSLLECLDATLRTLGGAPTYALTDNEKTVTVKHIARVPVRHPDIVATGGHYGMTIRTCAPADPQTKGGSEATVRVAKADLVPTEANVGLTRPMR